jgi:hypothetical protein
VRINEIRGQVFGRLTAICPLPDRGKDRHIIWEFKCTCGNSWFGSSSLVKRGAVRSCGCLMRESYKRTTEHKARMSKAVSGERNHNWKGEKASQESGRCRCNRLYRDIGPCILCGNPKSERHHIDGNTLNNDPSNIMICCRKCHMQQDGRSKWLRARGWSEYWDKVRVLRWQKKEDEK